MILPPEILQAFAECHFSQDEIPMRAEEKLYAKIALHVIDEARSRWADSPDEYTINHHLAVMRKELTGEITTGD
jgi:hypothetical protein